MFNNQKIVRAYDRLMNNSRQRRYYGDSGFYNFGYWATGATNQRAASEALVDVLVERLPQQHGNILDVACGMGASRRRLEQEPGRTAGEGARSGSEDRPGSARSQG